MTDKAAHVQAGIDPLVAEIEALVAELLSPSDGWTGDACCVSDEVAEKAATLIRSQAERIAALTRDIDGLELRFELELDAYAKDSDMAALRTRAEAAESLLAEAREALEEIEKLRLVPASYASDIARATLSRLKPGEKGGE